MCDAQNTRASCLFVSQFCFRSTTNVQLNWKWTLWCGCTSEGCGCIGEGCGCTSEGCGCTSEGCGCIGEGCGCTGEGCGCIGEGCGCIRRDEGCGCIQRDEGWGCIRRDEWCGCIQRDEGCGCVWEQLEKKGPRGPSHSPTASYLAFGLWTEHQHHMALPAGQTSLTQVTLSSPNQNTPLLCTPSNFNLCNYSTCYSFTQL